jgi:hypothetical protein
MRSEWKKAPDNLDKIGFCLIYAVFIYRFSPILNFPFAFLSYSMIKSISIKRARIFALLLRERRGIKR